MTTSTFDGMVAMFERTGLNRKAAVVAAIGRDCRSEAEARAAWDRCDAEAAAESAAMAAVLGPTGRAPSVAPEVQAVCEAAQQRLGMDRVEALEYAAGLRARETARHGADHARTYLTEFARTLSGAAT